MTSESRAPVAVASLAGEVARLRRQLQREQARREAAETIGERATSDLYHIVRELRAAQSELVERANQERLVSELGRALRQVLEPEHLVNRAAALVGEALRVDRCEVMLGESSSSPSGYGSWPRDAHAEAQPRTSGIEDHPGPLRELLVAAAQRFDPVQIDHLSQDQRLGDGAADTATRLGMEALAAVPSTVGSEVIGWILIESRTPRNWTPREIAICETLARDLAVALVQAYAFEKQRLSVERLEQLDRTKDAFISTVSHELRTPLTSIVGYLEVMGDGGMGELSPELAHGVEIVQRNAVRLRAVVEDLLTLSAHDADALQLEPVPVDLKAIVEECQRSLLPAASDQAVEITLELDEDCPRPQGDEEQLHRVVLNLLNNGVKFTRRGGRVTVTLRVEEAMAVLRISDNGIGIPEDELPHVFERFFRSSLSVRDEVQGTGLGLALAQTVVTAHGGSLELQSQVGVGTTATVRLPVES